MKSEQVYFTETVLLFLVSHDHFALLLVSEALKTSGGLGSLVRTASKMFNRNQSNLFVIYKKAGWPFCK